MDKKAIPLHPAQHDVYTEQLIDRNSPLYNVGGYIRLKGHLEPTALTNIIGNGPAVFDAFTLRFDMDSADHLAYINEATKTLEVELINFSNHLDAGEKALQWVSNDFNIAFTINLDAMLCRHVLVKISDNEHWLYGKYHHLIIDGYGFIVWVKYLAEAYRAKVAGSPLVFEAPQYIPQIQANAHLSHSQTAVDLQYWVQQLKDTQRPALHKKNIALSSHAYKVLQREIDGRQQEVISHVLKATKCNLLQLTLAALTIYFGRGPGLKQVVFGLPLHKRNSRQLRNVLGMFSGILPFLGQLNNIVTIGQLLADISLRLKEDYKHQQSSLGQISRALKVLYPNERLFDIMLNYEPFNFSLDFGSGIESSIYQLAANVARSPLQFTWQDHGQQQPLQLQVDYDEAYMSKDQVNAMVESLFLIFNQFDDPEKTVDEVMILGKEEAGMLADFVPSFQQTDQPGIIDLIQQQVFKNPEAIAVIINDEHYTYRQLNQFSNQIAHHLIESGVGAETLVPVCMERGLPMLAVIFGILKSGAAYVPIDPAYPTDRIAFMLKDTKAGIVLTHNHLVLKIGVLQNLQVIACDTLEIFSTYPLSDPPITILPNQLAYVIYTSGSTGVPKGVMIEHRNTSAFINWCMHEFDAALFDVVYASTSVCFDLSVFEIFYPLSIGKTIRLLENGLDISTHLSTDKKVLINTVPIVIENLVQQHIDLSNVTVLNMAGEPVPLSLLQQLDTDKIEVRNLYGPTEDTTYSTVFRLHNNSPVLIGKPITNSYIYLLNQQNQFVPFGWQGEICIGGAGLARGYLYRDELTAEKFIKDPFSNQPDARLYKTGDLGVWQSDGNLEYEGRIDQQVKIRGHRIELGEIESIVKQSGLVENMVAAVHQTKTGDKILVGYVVSSAGIDNMELSQILRDKLPEYMIPAVWVVLDALPLTPNGKIDRKNLPSPGIEPNAIKEYQKPESETESLLAEIWQDVLGLQKVSVLANFFEVGGHSIRAIQVISRLQKQHHIKADFGLFIHYPTIRQFAPHIKKEVNAGDISILPVPLKNLYPLSNAQKRTWVLCQLPGGNASFNSPALFSIHNLADTGLLQKALFYLIQLHESLRTGFVEIEGEPWQKIVPANEISFLLTTVDYSTVANADSAIDNLLRKEIDKQFDLKSPPLVRAIAINKTVNEQLLFINIHHIISDGWSKDILINDFVSILTQLAKGSNVQQAINPVQYKEYVAWQTNQIQKQQQYWQKQLQAYPVLQFPMDAVRPAIPGFSGEMEQLVLTQNITQKIKAFTLANQLTINQFLFATYGALLAHYSNQNEVMIGSLASGRGHNDLEHIVGLFINFLPVKLYPKPEISLNEYLATSRDILVQAYDHQDYPFDLMVQHFIPGRNFSRNPFFDTMVNFHSEDQHQGQFTIPQNNGDDILIKPLQQFKQDLFQSNLDFKLDIEPINDELVLNLSYNAKLFSRQRMNTFLQQYALLVSAVLENADQKLGDYLSFPVLPGVDVEAPQAEPQNDSCKVCICSSFVCEPVEDYMKYWSGEYALNLNIVFADYNQVFQQLLNPSSVFNTNHCVNVLLIRMEDWLRDKQHLATSKMTGFLDVAFAELLTALQVSLQVSTAPVIIGIVPVSCHKEMDQEIINKFNALGQQLETTLQKQPRYNIINFSNVAALYDVDEMFDKEGDDLGHIPFTAEFFAALGTYLVRLVRSYKGHTFKVLALDADNTLWKGICGEIGALQVDINQNFTNLQQFLLKKYHEGFLLVLCSKNNETDVWEVFDQHEKMLLKKEQIAAYRINWSDKPGNMQQIAKELNVGLDSFIFIDDNPFEVEQMQMALPEVLSLTLPAVENDIPGFLEHTWEFDVFNITEEDARRNEMYQTERNRRQEQEEHSSLNDFMRSLEIKVVVRPMTEQDIERAGQLSLRTNQFNLNGIRRSRHEVADRLNKPENLNWMIDISDRFGDYGTSGLLFASTERSTLVLEAFLLSCRVLGRGVEDIVMKELNKYCLKNDLAEIKALFSSTEKNKPFQNFLQQGDWQKAADGTLQIHVKYSTEEITT